MERYNKYLVLKITDIEKYLSDEKQLKLDALVTCIRAGRLNDGKRDQEYVCVAADWPMHEQVWGMVEAFADGKPNEIEQLTARVRELEAENARIREKLLPYPKLAHNTGFFHLQEFFEEILSIPASTKASITLNNTVITVPNEPIIFTITTIAGSSIVANFLITPPTLENKF